MSLLERTSVLILTYNEAPNIARTLEALARFNSITVLDSGSTDETADIVAGFPNARFISRPFDDHASQWNFGLGVVGNEREWVLALDADYVLTPELIEEIDRLEPATDVTGFRIAFGYCVLGKALRGSLYPPSVCLFRRAKGVYRQEGHTQRVVLPGRIQDLAGRILHDDRKPLGRWLDSQRKYARLEADYLYDKKKQDLRKIDKIRLTGWLGPPLVFLYTLFYKGCIRDGWAGWLYVLQRLIAETMIALEVVDRKMRGRAGAG